MQQPDVSNHRFNLDKASVLILDGDPMSTTILSSILSGFGAKNLHKCATVELAKGILARSLVDLVVIDPAMLGPDGWDFIPWLRRHGTPQNKHASVLIVTGHTQGSRVKAARDAGANFVVAKPLTPTVVHDRIVWMGRDRRPFVECKVYAGPDRRFKFEGPPANSDGRRDSDLSADVGAASEPNMSQDDIDAMMQPRKISL
jgi:DNA-binding response OmpR family regulator